MLAQTEVSPTYLGLSNSVTAAELRGTSGVTTSLTVTGFFVPDRRQWKFNTFTMGLYKLFTNTGAGLTEDTTWAGSGVDGLGIFGGDIINGIGGLVTIASDTNALKLIDGDLAYLTGLSSSNQNGGGIYERRDSTWIEGIIAYDHPIVNDQWILKRWLIHKTFTIEDAGAIADNGVTDSRPFIQRGIDFLFNNSGGILEVPVVRKDVGSYYSVTKNPLFAYAIEMRPQVTLRGAGSSPNPQASTIRLADNQDSCWVIGTISATFADTSGDQSANPFWSHNMRIESLRIEPNGANQTIFAGGINYDQPGEVSAIRDIIISGHKGGDKDGKAGFRIDLGAPGVVENISVFPASGETSCGIELTGASSTYIQSLSGDNNIPFIRHLGGKYIVGNVKVEYSVIPHDTTSIIETKATFSSSIIINSGFINAGSLVKGCAIKIQKDDAALIPSGQIHIQTAGLKYMYINKSRSDTLLESELGQSSRGIEFGVGTSFHYIDANTRYSNTSKIEYYDDQKTFRNFANFRVDGGITMDSRSSWDLRVGNVNILRMFSNRIETLKEIKAIAGIRIGGDPNSLITVADVIGTSPNDTLIFTVGGIGYKAPRNLVNLFTDTLKIKRSSDDFQLHSFSGGSNPVFATFSTSFERTVLDFSDAVSSAAQVSFTTEVNVAGSVARWVDIYWFSSATSGDVVWGIHTMVSTKGGAAASGVPSIITATTTTNAVANTYNKTRIESSTIDAWGIDDDIRIRITRNGADVNDTMTSDARLQWIIINYLR